METEEGTGVGSDRDGGCTVSACSGKNGASSSVDRGNVEQDIHSTSCVSSSECSSSSSSSGWHGSPSSRSAYIPMAKGRKRPKSKKGAANVKGRKGGNKGRRKGRKTIKVSNCFENCCE